MKLITMGVRGNEDIRLHAVLLHAQAAIVEFYDWLLYEVSPSPLTAASVEAELERRRGGPELPATNLNPRKVDKTLSSALFWEYSN